MNKKRNKKQNVFEASLAPNFLKKNITSQISLESILTPYTRYQVCFLRISTSTFFKSILTPNFYQINPQLPKCVCLVSKCCRVLYILYYVSTASEQHAPRVQADELMAGFTPNVFYQTIPTPHSLKIIVTPISVVACYWS